MSTFHVVALIRPVDGFGSSFANTPFDPQFTIEEEPRAIGDLLIGEGLISLLQAQARIEQSQLTSLGIMDFFVVERDGDRVVSYWAAPRLYADEALPLMGYALDLALRQSQGNADAGAALVDLVDRLEQELARRGVSPT